MSSTAVLQLPQSSETEETWRKLTHLTVEAPTSAVHARMTQPTFIFAGPRVKGGKKERKREEGRDESSSPSTPQ